MKMHDDIQFGDEIEAERPGFESLQHNGLGNGERHQPGKFDLLGADINTRYILISGAFEKANRSG